MVKPVDGFSVARVEGEFPRSQLLWEGEPTAIRVDGATLEHQVQLPSGYLLFLTEDRPYEERLHIYLLDRDRHVIDGLELAAPYASGILSHVMPDGDDAVSFSFFGDDRWRVEVKHTPLGFLAGRVSAPVTRKSGGKRLMTVRRIK